MVNWSHITVGWGIMCPNDLDISDSQPGCPALQSQYLGNVAAWECLVRQPSVDSVDCQAGPGQIILINWERERERERERTWPGYHLPPVIITSLSPWLRSLTCLGLSSTSPIISISQLKFYPISSLSWQSCRPYIDSRQTPPLLLCCQIQIFCSCFVKVTFR